MNYLKNLIILLTIGTTTLSSCTEESCEATGNCPEANAAKIIERIDIKTESEETLFYFKESIEEQTDTDLISFNHYGSSSNKIDFKIRLSENELLIVKLYNGRTPNPWEIDNASYDFFATQDLDTKWQYVTAELVDQENFESPMYSSNIGTQAPLGTFLDVFRIETVDLQKKEIHCRINKMILHKNGHPTNTLEINGTFRAALTFL